jgi:hypothetical protein
MVNLRLRRAGLPIAVSAVVAAVAVTGTIFAMGTAGAETVTATTVTAAADPAAQRAAVAAARKAAPKLSASGKRALAAAADEQDYGDITGDGKADLAAIDSGGAMWVYPGKRYIYPGSGTRSKNIFGTRQLVGTGWGKFNSLVRHGSFNGDDRQDILTRDAKGNLAFYAGTGDPAAMFKKGTPAGTGWGNFVSITGAGDLNGDGRDDLLGQKTNGDLALYTGTGTIAKPFSTRGTIIGTGWKGDLLTALGDVTGDGRSEFAFRNTKGLVTYYDSKSGANPIGKGTVVITDGDVGKFLKNIVGPGDLTSDAGYTPTPDTVWQFKDGYLYVIAYDSDPDGDAEIGSGWGSFRLF